MDEYRKIEVSDLGASTVDQRYLLTCGERHFEANAMVVGLLRMLQEAPDETTAIADYVLHCGGRYSEEQVEAFVVTYLRPIAIGGGSGKKRQFLYECELFSAQAVDRLSDVLAVLFTPWVIITVVIGVLVADIWFMLTAPNLLRINGGVSVYGMAGLLLFMGASSMFHELGHAAACKRMGVRHGGIGFGMYLTFPVLYTDVSQVWRLPRRQRLVVNIAGVYFQCLILVGLLAWYYCVEGMAADMARYLILTMNLGFVLTLNPFFRFDGYWIASDALGIPNLRQRSYEVLGWLWRRILHKESGRRPYLMQISGTAKWIMAVYTVAVNAFMGFYFFYVLPGFLWSFTKSFPAEAERLVFYVANGMTPPFALIRNIAMQLVFLAMIIYMVRGLSRPLRNKYAGKKQK